MSKAAIRHISIHLPVQTLTNQRLAQEYQDWDEAKILEKTGIAVRHIAGPDECSSDLGVAAAEKLFASGVCARDDVDFLFLCTQSPDYFLPTTACLMQDRLGLKTGCGALDFNQGCSGFVYGLSLAKGMVETADCRNVLLITAETYSKFVNPRDRSARTIFGDGAAATLVSAVESDRDLIGPFAFGTDGKGAGHLIVPAGGFRCPRSSETAIETQDRGGNWRSKQDLFMNGPEILNFTIRVAPVMLNQLLEKACLEIEDIDYFVFHQANRFMLDHLRNKLKIPAEKFCVCLENCGNTVSSTIPIALESAMQDSHIRTGSRVLLLGFGVGLSWAGAIIEIV